MFSRKLLDSCNDWGKHLCLIDRFLTLKDCNGTFDSHTGIDALSLHLTIGTVTVLLVPHEDIIPDLEIFPTGTPGAAIRATRRSSSIDEHLTVWTTRTGFSCWSPPVILSSEIIDSFTWNSISFPRSGSILITGNLIISCKNSHRQEGRINAKDLCKELITEGYCFLLEVIPKGPVTQHLKESEMVWVPYRFNISGSDTLLVIGKAGACWVFASHDIGYQGVHTGGGKQDRWVVLGNQGSPTDLGMILGYEEINEFLP